MICQLKFLFNKAIALSFCFTSLILSVIYYMKDTKKCTKCQEEKTLDNFSKVSNRETLKTMCRSCVSDYNKKYNKENKEKCDQLRKAWIANDENRKKRDEYMLTYNKEYRKKNKEKVDAQAKAWRENNPEKVKQSRTKRRDKARKWKKEQYATNPIYKLGVNIRNHATKISQIVKTKKGKTSLEYLGCTLEEFKAHIESQWQEGMTWENHSKDGWHIDHIVPINWYVKNSDDPWQANHYTNLQPLWAKENLSKNNKIK